jgi:hypothetical protein
MATSGAQRFAAMADVAHTLVGIVNGTKSRDQRR